jgi:hypothetical protein
MKKTIYTAFLALSFFLAIFTSSLGHSPRVHAATQTTYINGKIAYTAIDGGWSMFMRNGDGSNKVKVYGCSGAGIVTPGSWSPNGKQLYFSSTCATPNYADIYRVNVDGTGMVNLTNTPTTREEGPVLSPDGTKIAYVSDKNRSIADYRLWLMNADGTGATDISNGASTGDRFVSWSTDSSKIYYSSTRSGSEQLYVHDVSANSDTQYTSFTGTSLYPQVSPDGNKIIFSHLGAGDSQLQLYTQDINGANLKRFIQPCNYFSEYPFWSPDGKKVAYDTGCDDTVNHTNTSIHIVGVDGTGDKRITDVGENDASLPVWQRVPVTSTTEDPHTGRTEHEQDDDHHDTDYEVDDGVNLIVNGSVGTVLVHGGGILKGHGAVADLNVANQGHLAPGNSPGCIATNNLNLASGSSLDEEIGGTTACSGYDQTNVTGTVTLTNPTLNTTLYGGFIPSVGNAYTIIDNDGSDAVTGTFNNLAEGAAFTASGVTYKITYAGGDGNDVVLTVTAVDQAVAAAASTPKAPNTGLALISANAPLAAAISVVAAGILLFTARRSGWQLRR